MDLVLFDGYRSQVWTLSKKRKKTPPIARLRKLLETYDDDVFPDAYGSTFTYFCETPEDYGVFSAMLKHAYCCYHIAFRYGMDWSIKTSTRKDDATVSLENPEVILTPFGAWLFWMCYIVSEKQFVSELIVCKDEDYYFEPRHD